MCFRSEDAIMTVNQCILGGISMAKELPACPMEAALDLFGEKWKLMILKGLMGGTRRSGELLRDVPGASRKMLTNNLREMEEDGLLTREIFAEVPARVEYTLTELGYSVRPVLEAVEAWGNQFCPGGQKK